MTRNQMNTYLAAMLTSIDGMPGKWAPEGPMYAALNAHGASLVDFQQVVGVLVDAGLCDRQAGSHTLRLTDKGLDMVAKINAHFARQQQN